MTDDEKYMALMGKYKSLRGKEGPKANKYLIAAQSLAGKGGVSEEVIIGSAYL